MKNIQTSVLKILTLAGLVLFSQNVVAESAPESLYKADSLFTKKQYTQSFEIYQELKANGFHSPAMLLKMAFIQEGLGHVSLSLYYLNLYYLASGDEQALNKMDEVAAKNRLEGYAHSNTTHLLFNLNKYRFHVSLTLLALAILLLALQYRFVNKKSTSVSPAIFAMLVLLVLASHVNFSLAQPAAIISNSNTYLMTGPSAGASVVTQINEGHKLKVTDKKDVWLKVEWLDQVAYVKETQVLPIEL